MFRIALPKRGHSPRPGGPWPVTDRRPSRCGLLMKTGLRRSPCWCCVDGLLVHFTCFVSLAVGCSRRSVYNTPAFGALAGDEKESDSLCKAKAIVKSSPVRAIQRCRCRDSCRVYVSADRTLRNGSPSWWITAHICIKTHLEPNGTPAGLI